MKGIYLTAVLCTIYLSYANAQDCTGKKLGENIPNPTDCNKYYTCIGGPVARQCPRTLHWNNAKQTCDYPERANCVSSHKISVQEKICSATGNGFYRYPSDCSKGILCHENKMLRIYSCPSPLWMNVETMGCEPAQYVNCSEK